MERFKKFIQRKESAEEDEGKDVEESSEGLKIRLEEKAIKFEMLERVLNENQRLMQEMKEENKKKEAIINDLKSQIAYWKNEFNTAITGDQFLSFSK